MTPLAMERWVNPPPVSKGQWVGTAWPPLSPAWPYKEWIFADRDMAKFYERDQANDWVLYRCYSDDLLLLYLGITRSPWQRLSAHRSTAPWWPRVYDILMCGYPTKRAVLGAEVSAIKRERPLYNSTSAVRI